jgi:hypothetical protein
MSEAREFFSFLVLKFSLIVLVPWMATTASMHPWWVVGFFATCIWTLPILCEHAFFYLDGGDIDGPGSKAIWTAHLIPAFLLLLLLFLGRVSLVATAIVLVLELALYYFRDSFRDQPIIASPQSLAICGLVLIAITARIFLALGHIDQLAGATIFWGSLTATVGSIGMHRFLAAFRYTNKGVLLTLALFIAGSGYKLFTERVVIHPIGDGILLILFAIATLILELITETNKLSLLIMRSRV